MRENKYILNLKDARGNIKNPKLNETCNFYGIEFDSKKHHTATYDVTKTYEILKIMNYFNKMRY